MILKAAIGPLARPADATARTGIGSSSILGLALTASVFAGLVLGSGCQDFSYEDISAAEGPVMADDDTPHPHMCGEDWFEPDKLDHELVTKAVADNPYGLAVQVLTPYAATTETHPDWGPPGHPAPWLGDWAGDLWQDNGGAGVGNSCGDAIYLKVRAVQVPGAQLAEEVRARVVAQGYACASDVYAQGGLMQKYTIEARYGSTWYELGWVLIAHLDQNLARNVGDVFDPTNAYLGTAFQGGTTGPCWGSCHVHVEFHNTRGTSCYDLLPPTTGIASDESVGVLGGNLGGGNCPDYTPPPPPPSCPYGSIQMRVQENTSVPWSTSIGIDEGDSFHVGAFKDGSGAFVDCCTTITVIDPNGNVSNVANDSYVGPVIPGTYTVQASCGGLTDTATVQVTAIGSCPYNTLQTRVQKDLSEPWSLATTIGLGQSFHVGTFKNGSGTFTDCCTDITITGPNGDGGNVGNDSWFTPQYEGTYQVEGRCGPLVEVATVTVGTGEVVVGQVTVNQPSVGTWHTVSFVEPMAAVPVVVMSPVSYANSEPTTVRVRNVSATGFQFQLDEWNYLNGLHTYETLYYVAVTPGVHQWSGMQVVAGELSTNQYFTSASFPASFGTTPVVLSQAASVNGPAAVTVRLRNITYSGFEASLREEEAADNWHPYETVGYIAFAPGTGSTGSYLVRAGQTPIAVNHDWYTIGFGGVLTSPMFFANMQTYQGGDTAALRYSGLTTTDVQVTVEEEQSLDTEVAHAREGVGWVVFDYIP